MARKPKQVLEAAQPEITAKKLPPFIEVTNQERLDVEYRSRCGGALRTAREKQGLTTHEIASRLRLSHKQIEALEADNFAVLPEATIVKGFIRNYAKQLKLEAEPLLDAYNVIVPSKAPQSFTLQPSVDMRVTEYQKPSFLRNTILTAFIMLAFAAWLFYQHYVQKPSPVKPSAELTEQTAIDALPEAALPAAERLQEQVVTSPESSTANTPAPASAATESVITPTPATPAAASVATPATPEDSSTPTPPATTTVASSPTLGAPVAGSGQMDKNLSNSATISPQAGMTKLEFVAFQETWINVVDASGKEIYSKTLFDGNRESLSIKPPVNITVGNSLGTTLNVNGKTVDLAPHTRTNVAHIKVD